MSTQIEDTKEVILFSLYKDASTNSSEVPNRLTKNSKVDYEELFDDVRGESSTRGGFYADEFIQN